MPEPINERDKLGARFMRASQHFHHFQMRTTWTLLSSTQFFALGVIKWASQPNPEEGFIPLVTEQVVASTTGISVSAIAQRMHSSMPSTSRMLGKLESRGLITRERDTRDRRNTLVYLTPEGEHTYAEAYGRLVEYLGLVVDELGEQRTLQIANDLDDTTAAMDNALRTMEQRHPEYRDVQPPPHPPFPPDGCGHGAPNDASHAEGNTYRDNRKAGD